MNASPKELDALQAEADALKRLQPETAALDAAPSRTLISVGEDL